MILTLSRIPLSMRLEEQGPRPVDVRKQIRQVSSGGMLTSLARISSGDKDTNLCQLVQL